MRMGEWSERKTEEEEEGEIGGRNMRGPRNRGGKEENWEEEDVYVKNEEEKDVEKEVYEDEEDGEEERVSSCLFTIVKTI